MSTTIQGFELTTDFFTSSLPAETTNATSSSDSTGPTDAEKFGYGTLAVVIISICPILSVAIVGFQKSRFYKFVISALLGLCVGSLVGDSLLHLIPQILGVHGHAESEEEHEHGHEHEDGHEHEHEEHEHNQDYIWKMLVSCVSVWGFLILQMVIQGVGELIEKRKKKKMQNDINLNEIVYTNTAMTIESDVDLYPKDVTLSQQVNNRPSENVRRNESDGDDESLHVHAHSSVAWMVTIGDALHNFTDGLAIGAAFSKSLTSGLAISIAVLCHELPHEFGDAALMLSAGWSFKLVLLLQFLAQLTAFIGLYIGIALSNAFDEAQTWIFAIAAGMFLYVALCDAVPEIMELVRHHKSVVMAILSNVGIAVGFVIMILLGVYEEQIVIH